MTTKTVKSKILKQLSFNSLLIVTTYVLLIAFLTTNLLVILAKLNLKSVHAQDTSINSRDAEYLQALARTHPDYMPAWLRLAELSAISGDTQEALVVLEYARLLDPNSEELLLIEKKIKYSD